MTGLTYIAGCSEKQVEKPQPVKQVVSSLPASKAQVAHQGDTVIIKGVPLVMWGKTGNNTFMATLSAILNTVGDSMPYEYLMGISGAAFRFQIHLEGW